MKIAELKQKSPVELAKLLSECRARIDNLRFLLRQKKVKNVKEQARLKKDVARILTLHNIPDLVSKETKSGMTTS